MAKGYIIARITVHDPESYQRYAQAAVQAQCVYGARVLVRGGRSEPLEGTACPRNVVLEFDSYEAARAYYDSPEYQAARAFRIGKSEGDFVLVEGA